MTPPTWFSPTTVALGYAAGFNAMVFLPLHGARAQNTASQSASGGSEATGISADELTSPATASDAGAVLAQAQRLAQASNKAPGQIQTAAAKTGAATPDFAPPGGVAGLGQVDPSTGKLTFSGPIASVGGKTSPSFSLSVSYSSTQVYETAINWNYEQAPSEVGLGFTLPSAHLRIARLASPTGVAWNDSFMLMAGSSA